MIALIIFFGFGAGTALAHSSTGAWNISPNDTQVFSNLSVAPVRLGTLDGSTRLASTHAATGAQRRAFVGTVTVTGVDSVTLELQGTEKPQTITLPPGFEFKTPGEPRAGTFDVKAQLVILAKRVDGAWVAFMGLVKPEKPSFVPFTGVVTAVNDGVVTVESPDGDVQTLALPGDLGEVALGEVVTVFEEGSGKVTGLVKADQVRKRLNKFLEAASNEEGDEESSQDTDQRSRRADALARTLENFGARHLEVLNRVGGRVQEAVKRQIEIIKAKVKSDRRNSQAIIERVKKKLRVGHGESEPPGHGDRPPVPQ